MVNTLFIAFFVKLLELRKKRAETNILNSVKRSFISSVSAKSNVFSLCFEVFSSFELSKQMNKDRQFSDRLKIKLF